MFRVNDRCFGPRIYNFYFLANKLHNTNILATKTLKSSHQLLISRRHDACFWQLENAEKISHIGSQMLVEVSFWTERNWIIGVWGYKRQKSRLTCNPILNANFNIASINSSYLVLTHCQLLCDIENNLS